MSKAISNHAILAFTQKHMDKYGELLEDKMHGAERNAQMMEDFAKVEAALAAWRATNSNNDTDKNGLSVQKEAIIAMEDLIETYPELADDFSSFLPYAKKYIQGTDKTGCDNLIDGMVKKLDGMKDGYAKHDQLTMLEINDLNSKYNRLAEQASQMMASASRTLDSIVKNLGS